MDSRKVRHVCPRKFLKRLLLGGLLICLSFSLFGAIYVFRMNTWLNFDANRILGAPNSLLIFDAEGTQVSCLSAGETRVSIPLEQVPLHVRHAFISAEDARFYEHIGVDFIRILGAAWEDIKAGSYVQGASTINQQLVKLSHLNSKKVMARKLEEAVLAYQMEQQYSKDEILEMYLNYIYFGGGFYGIQAAAKGYFGVSTDKLTVAQGALLAGIVNAPSRIAPHIDMEASIQRRNRVLRLMQEYGYIDASTCAKAQSESVVLNNGLKKDIRGYYIDLALEEACSVMGLSMPELLTGGYRIHTAMDSGLQRHCEEILQKDELFPDADKNVQAALVVMDVKSGCVVALMGGRENTGALTFNRAVRIRRQPGSVIKPVIVYAPALENFCYTTVSMLLDEETDFNGYQPDNYGRRYHGWVTLRDAVAQSLNIPAVKVFSDIGVETGKSFAKKVGISFDERDEGLTLALGGFTYGVSPFQMAGAYSAFASGGVYSTPSLVRLVTDRQENVLYTHKPECNRVMSEANAYILSDMLQSVIVDGTGHRLGDLHLTLAGKTGTAGEGEGNRDAWMVAYNPEYSAAVWMGYDDSTGGRTLPKGTTGGTYPALILTEIFSKIYEANPAPGFTMPEGVVEVQLDSHTLKEEHIPVLASVLTPSHSMVREVFASGTEPNNISNYWVVPTPPTAFSCVLDSNGMPEISFQPVEDFVNYRLYREDKARNIAYIGEWSGGHGKIQYVDKGVHPGEEYSYYVIPVHPELKIGGKQVVGPSSNKAEVSVPSNPFVAGLLGH